MVGARRLVTAAVALMMAAAVVAVAAPGPAVGGDAPVPPPPPSATSADANTPAARPIAACRPADHRGTVFCGAGAGPLTLGADDIPANTSVLHVESVTHLVVSSNATLHLPRLQSVVLRHIGVLTLHKNALSSRTGLLHEVTVSGVGTARLVEGAVAGRWSSTAHLRFSNISNLVLDGRALVAPLAAVTLTNVSLARCRTGTFGTGISRLTLVDSRLGAAEALCVRLRRGVGVFAVRQSRIESLLAMSVTSMTSAASAGRLDALEITDSSIGVWQSRAVTGRLNRLLVSRTSIRELDTEAVHAIIPRFVFSEVAVHIAHSSALAGIQQSRSFTLEAVSVSRAEAGALMLNSSVDVRGVELSRVYVNTPCHCDMASEAVRLAAGNDTEDCCTPVQTTVSRLLVDAAFCTMPGQPSVLARFSEAACVEEERSTSVSPAPDAAEKPQLQPRQQSDGEDQTVVFAVVLAGLAAAILTCIYCGVTRRKRLLAAVRYVSGRQPASSDVRGSSVPRQPRRPRYSAQSSQNSRADLLSQNGSQSSSTGSKTCRPRYCSQSSRTALVVAEGADTEGSLPRSNGVAPHTGLASVSGAVGQAKSLITERPGVVTGPSNGARTPSGQIANSVDRRGAFVGGYRGGNPTGASHAELVSIAGEVENTINRVRRAHPEHYC